MWIKKTIKEIANNNKENDNRSIFKIIGGVFFGSVLLDIFLRKVVGFSLGVFLLNILFSRTSIELPKCSGQQKSWIEIYNSLPEILLVGLILGIFVNMFLVTKKNKKVCPKCGKYEYKDRAFNCSCGGKLEKISGMKWIEGNE